MLGYHKFIDKVVGKQVAMFLLSHLSQKACGISFAAVLCLVTDVKAENLSTRSALDNSQSFQPTLKVSTTSIDFGHCIQMLGLF